MHHKLQHHFQRIEQQQKYLLNSLNSLDNQQLNTKPSNGGWSPLQVVNHLILVEQGSLAYMKKKLEYKTNIPKANAITHIRSRLMNVTFQTPIKFKAPKVASNVGEELDLDELHKNWKHNRAELKHFLNAFPEDLIDHCVYKHPLVGRLTVYHALSFFSQHLERHRKQIVRALERS